MVRAADVVDGAEAEGETVASAAPVAADEAEGSGDADAVRCPVPAAADAGTALSMPAHSPSARAGTHVCLERNELSFRLGGSRAVSMPTEIAHMFDM
ncbi:hypothetical protein SRB17_69870 [Streptomyces sp. RB17]|nr:hypothetical protein [Streptomyces sp. RB17]